MMGKIVGKFFVLLFLLYVQGTYADVSLRILNEDHSPFVQAAAGSPFLVEVSVQDIRSNQLPTIQGLDQFEVHNKGVQFTIVNGRFMAKYTFEVRITTPGTYTIGPAIINAGQNKQESSNSVRVIVGNETINTKKNNKEDNPVLLRLVASKERAVVGECVHCWLRFYYTDPSITLRQFIEHDSKDICRKKVKGPYTGTQQLQGVNYNYIEWEWDMFPQKAGHCTIPAYGADYEQEIEEKRDDLWGGLGRLLGTNVISKRVYSNAITLNVDALPASTTPIQAVGSFSAMTLSAKPAIAKQQEGIVVAVEIMGEGDPDAITFSTLENVPEALRFYASNTTVIEPTKEGELPKKRYEFIVQGLKVGTWEIPAQSLYCFDTKQRKFNTLQTTPLSITIMPSTKKMVTITDEDDEAAQIQQQTSLAPLHKEWSNIAVPEWQIPWWLFFMLISMPTFYAGYGWLSRVFTKNKRDSYQNRRAQQAFITAQQRLVILKETYNAKELYTLFIELFADRWQMGITAISAHEIKQRLQDKGFSDTQLQAWDTFFSQIAERAFGANKGQEDTYLFDKAKQWIEQLEQLL